ncbi:MAG: type II toxin-antitoxin system HicA family toxin [Deltaproteobacteria bacterium]|nr:type II toxin-antitoxin system HicA family toxin [Deltaproteobacteria bacterium]MBW1727192.1 type II toxin-antitoxin system HicA family toxin [Deltaproteobacteria bacterium]MBW1908080.1 type II toxin-antitoxin system HicA family toxin [Deltaproteobacteria bacterium]MBW2032142.1 type II toxin-antitoxin system HicA family toxin [Deltaproteobacteria bacterium]MBW2113380.1 type II toxin-antitoxin system HicA family toxin [Deltaproteobacteria bacterium]
MTRLPTVASRTMIAFLKYLGFEKSRQHGSHIFFRHYDGRTATVPDHKGENLGRGITNKILHDVDVSRKDFIDWLGKKK